jgi:hypothetical protein
MSGDRCRMKKKTEEGRPMTEENKTYRKGNKEIKKAFKSGVPEEHLWHQGNKISFNKNFPFLGDIFLIDFVS